MADKEQTEQTQQPAAARQDNPAQMGTEEANRRFDQIAEQEYKQEFDDMVASGSMGQGPQHGQQPSVTQEELAQLAQQKAMELEQIASEHVEQQMANRDPSEPVTMTELLAKEGPFAEKAGQLAPEAWQKFVEEQDKIAELRTQLVDVEKQRAADANRVAGIAPALEQEAGKVRKSSTITGVLGAVAGGAGATYLATKKSQSTPMRGLFGAAGAVLGGAIAAIAGARRGAKKAMDNVQQQVGDIGNLEPNEELEKKSAELQEQLGQAQQESIAGLTGAMVQSMVEEQVAAERQAAQQQAQGAAEQEQGAAEKEGAGKEGKSAEEGKPQSAPQQPAAGDGKHAEQGQAAVDKEFERLMTEEGMGPPAQHPQQEGAPQPQHPQAPRPPQQGGLVQQAAPLEQALAQRALAAQGGSKADAVLRERELQQGAEHQR